MKTIHILSFLLFVLLFSLKITAQNIQKLNLEEVIQRAQANAPEVNIAKAQLKYSHLQYHNFQLTFKPLLSLSADLPVYNRSIYPVTQPDGTQLFRRNQSLSTNLEGSFTKIMSKTGGSFYINTGLRQRLDFSPIGDGNNVNSYFSTPINIGFNQPLFTFNTYKWDKKIQPLILEEAQREYTEQLADIAQQAVTYFFDLYIAQLNLAAAKKDKKDAESLYQLAKDRFGVGKIAEADVLQMELGVMQADTRQATAELNIQSSTDNLRYFLGTDKVTDFELIAPADIPNYIIQVDLALEQAAYNRKYSLTQNRQRTEAERTIEQARKDNGFSVNLQAGFGLSKSDPTLRGAYAFPPEDQERISLGINVPIADWGRAKSQRELAQSSRDILEYSIEQENINFERNILLKIRQLDIIRSQFNIAKRTSEVAAKRYDITQKRYTVGKVDITELNLALNEQTAAHQSFMQALRDFWTAHYEIQRLTLYDFVNGRRLVD